MACGRIGSQMTYVNFELETCSEFWRKDGRLLRERLVRIASRPNQAQRGSISGY